MKDTEYIDAMFAWLNGGRREGKRRRVFDDAPVYEDATEVYRQVEFSMYGKSWSIRLVYRPDEDGRFVKKKVTLSYRFKADAPWIVFNGFDICTQRYGERHRFCEDTHDFGLVPGLFVHVLLNTPANVTEQRENATVGTMTSFVFTDGIDVGSLCFKRSEHILYEDGAETYWAGSVGEAADREMWE